jgi:hypothetical protein
LAGLPRISRASDEIRVRGWLAVAVAVATVGWWVVQWFVNQPLEPRRDGLVALVLAVVGGHLGWLNQRRRVRVGLRDPRRPSPRVVYETRADAGARRIRLSGAVFLTVMVVLAFDTLARWGGISAGIVVGAALAAGLADLAESRRWRVAERQRRTELYLLVKSDAFVASYGEPEVYEVPPDVAARERELGGFTV